MQKLIGVILTALAVAPVLAGEELNSKINVEALSTRIRQELEYRGVDVGGAIRIAREARASEVALQPKGERAAAGQDLAKKATTIFGNVYRAYRDMGILTSAPKLVIDASPVINAYAAQGREVRIYLALIELIHDSESELAGVMAHELGHIFQQRTGERLFVPDNPEWDADVWAVIGLIVAGYDPYAMSGSLAKLAMVSGDVGLIRQFEDEQSADMHKSFVSRIEVMYGFMTAVCGYNAEFQAACDEYRRTVHPHFPADAVM